MSSLIQAMSTDDVIICRRKGRYIKGRFKSTSEKRLKARMAVFPLTPNELLRLPEARRTTESLNFYSDHELKNKILNTLKKKGHIENQELKIERN